MLHFKDIKEWNEWATCINKQKAYILETKGTLKLANLEKELNSSFTGLTKKALKLLNRYKDTERKLIRIEKKYTV